MFNRTGGPSAAQALEGATTTENIDASSARRPEERAELIGQATLLLGDGLKRGVPPPHRQPPQESQASEPPPGLREADRLEQPPAEPSERVVTVEVCAVPTRGGRPRSTEVYPFGTISLSRKIDGELRGESFVIPYDDHPLRRLAAARKRHKDSGKRFMARKQEAGVRIWRSH